MIKLETRNVSPSALASLEIKSAGDSTSVVLGFEAHGGFVNEKWQNDIPGKRRQLLSFIGADGTACTMSGVVDDDDCLEVKACNKVVVQVRVSIGMKAAGEAGRVSKTYMNLEVVRVLEVWETPSKLLWSAVKQAPGATLEASGRITRSAA